MRKRIKSTITTEILGGAIALALSLAAVLWFLFSNYSYIVLTYGDSMVLPLFIKSFQSSHLPEWQFSNILFAPEILLYTSVSLIARLPHITLSLVALVILFSYFVLIRLLYQVLLQTKAPRRRMWISVASFSLLVGMLSLEVAQSGTDVRFSGNGTGADIGFRFLYMLMSPVFYWGALASLLLVLFFMAKFFNLRIEQQEKVLSPISWIAFAFCVIAFNVMSNFLVLVWVVAPILLSLAIAVILKKVNFKSASAFGSALILGSVIGVALQKLFRGLLPGSAGARFTPSELEKSISEYSYALRQSFSSATGTLDVVLLLILIIAFLVASVFALIRFDLAPSIWLVFMTGIIATIGIPLGTLAAGQFAMRYMLPSVILPFVLIIPALLMLKRHRDTADLAIQAKSTNSKNIWFICAAMAPVIVLGSIYADWSVKYQYAPAACLSRWADGQSQTGVGQFWTVRSASVYSKSNLKMLQVDPSMSPFKWMINTEQYATASPTFVIVGKKDPVWQSSNSQTLRVDNLGDPTEIVDCGDFSIFDYHGNNFALSELMKAVRG